MPKLRNSTPPVAPGESPRPLSGAPDSDEPTAPHSRSIVLRLKRAEGQIRGVLRMIAAGDSCNDVAQQLAAARNALDRAHFAMIACTLESEIKGAADDREHTGRVAEVLRILGKYA